MADFFLPWVGPAVGAGAGGAAVGASPRVTVVLASAWAGGNCLFAASLVRPYLTVNFETLYLSALRSTG